MIIVFLDKYFACQSGQMGELAIQSLKRILFILVGGMAKTYFPGKAAPWNLSSTVKLRRITMTGILDIFLIL